LLCWILDLTGKVSGFYLSVLFDSDRLFEIDDILYPKMLHLLNKLPPLQILLKEELQALFAERPDPKNKKQFKEWYKENGKACAEKLRQIMITHRNIGHDWQFTDQQQDLLWEYHTANNLLMECLGREAVIDRGVRSEIENTLFLPVSN
jgi:hypothetical protein